MKGFTSNFIVASCISIYVYSIFSLFLLLFCISVFHHVEILQWPSMRNNPLLLFAIINIFNCITKRSGQYIVMFIIAVFVSDCILLVYCAFYIRFCFVFGQHLFYVFSDNLTIKWLFFQTELCYKMDTFFVVVVIVTAVVILLYFYTIFKLYAFKFSE